LAVSDQRKFRISLWEINTTSGSTGGWRGAQKAVVFDAYNIGVEEYANDSGSAYWTLINTHPQIAEFLPLKRHYEISRWSGDRARWEFVAAGILDDYTSGEYETSFSGLDYKSILNQLFTPLVDMTVQNNSPLNPNATSISQGSLSANTATNMINSADVSVSSLTLTPSVSYEYYDVGTPVVRARTNAVTVSWTASWNGTTTGFPAGAIGINYYLYASPPALKDSGDPPFGKTGLIAAISSQSLSATGVNRFKFGTRSVTFLGTDFYTFWNDSFYNGKDIIDPDGTNVGPPTSAIAELATDTTVDYYGTVVAAPLRKGVSYSFQVYGAVVRTTPAATYRSFPPSQTFSSDLVTEVYPQVTFGQENNNAQSLIANIYQQAVTSDSYGRLRNTSFRTLTVINSGSTATTHRNFSAGEPVLDRIGNVADLEMGAKTTGGKVVFGISKPINGNSYTGGFTLNMNVSSAASSAVHLRYPENIKTFNYAPGFARVRNDITIIPSTPYLSGTGGQISNGVSITGAQVVDSSTISVYGRIPAVVQRSGLVDSSAATNEANRLLRTSNPSNSKQVGLSVTVDAIDLWNGWDVGDSIRVTIKRGITDIDEAFVISGVRWFGEGDGHERVELELVQGTAFGAQYAAPGGAPVATPSGK
jgi:hypothetical protein